MVWSFLGAHSEDASDEVVTNDVNEVAAVAEKEQEEVADLDEEEKAVRVVIDAVKKDHGFWIPGLSTVIPLVIEADGTRVFEITTTDSISVMPLESESIIRNSYGSLTETPRLVDGVEASDIIGTSAKDGSEIRYLLIKDSDNLYFLRGSNEFLDNVITKMEIAQE